MLNLSLKLLEFGFKEFMMELPSLTAFGDVLLSSSRGNLEEQLISTTD